MARRALLCTLLLAACGGDVPSQPTYFTDVQPIVRANCARCHGAEASSAKNAKFRLDRYVKDDDATFDLWDYAQAGENEPSPLVRVAVDHEAPAMPPDGSLTERQREILARWGEQGAPKGTRANRAPLISLLSPVGATTADQSLEVTFRAWDPDLDGLVVQLWAHDLAGSDAQDVPVSAMYGAGQRTVTVDTGALASNHRFELYAVLDDGFADDPAQNRTRAALLSELSVDHGARGTAPTVRLTKPNGGETAIGQVEITWIASDPDPGDVLTIDLELLRAASGDVAASIATRIPNSGSYAWTIPTTVPARDAAGPIEYLVRVTATDAQGAPPNVRSDSSDAPLTIAQATTTTLTWDDLKPIFVAYCVECHGQPARSMALESFRLDKYDASDPEPPANSDLGTFEMRGTVYQRMIVNRNMPPAVQPQPSAAELERVASWIEGGAPKGGGPSNARPTFAWVRPTATQTGSATVVLQWSAADAEGLMSGRLETTKVNGAPATGCGNVANATWTPINDPKASISLMGALTWADSLTWTIPSTPNGYYCVRGTVTDLAAQTTSTVNAFGIR